MEESMRIYARVDLDAIEHNICEMEKLQKQSVPMMAVIKTNGYGHGAVEIARLLEHNSIIC